MLKNVETVLEKPILYKKTEGEFWNDEHISMQMLKAHLNPEFDGASRKHAFIEESVAWITKLVSPIDYPLLCDIGCGPGIYAEKFARQGYYVTGIDFSKRSIDYAKNSALKQGLDIAYLYQNYLNMELNTAFDFATMIYCDYGALSTDDRKTLMQNVYSHLKSGGKFLLDVFSTEKYNSFLQTRTWEVCNNRRFWSNEKYVAFYGNYKYAPNVTLEQASIIKDSGVFQYYIWNTYFTKETLISEAQEVGFKFRGVWADVAGSVYSDKAFTLAMLFEK